jgi:hypothetical protein
MRTDDFVERLALGVRPVRPLRTPWVRGASWSLAASLYLGLLAVLMTSRDDLAANAAAPRFIVQQLAAIATSVSAAAAAFVSIVPGYSRRVLLLPAALATVWLTSTLVGSSQEWPDTGLAGLALQREWPCVVTIVFGSTLPACCLMFMLRRGAPLTPRLTAALSALASAGLAHVVACVSEPHSNNLVVLLWHGATVFAIVCVAGALGPSLFKWQTTLRAA